MINNYNPNKYEFMLSITEFELKIQEYYLKLDTLVTGVKVLYNSIRTSGTYDSFWQREIGGYTTPAAKVDIIREINALGEVRQVKDSVNLNNKQLEIVFNELLKEDNLEVKYIGDTIYKDKIKIECYKNVKQSREGRDGIVKTLRRVWR